jgi:hypothetical protein
MIHEAKNTKSIVDIYRNETLVLPNPIAKITKITAAEDEATTLRTRNQCKLSIRFARRKEDAYVDVDHYWQIITLLGLGRLPDSKLEAIFFSWASPTKVGVINTVRR